MRNETYVHVEPLRKEWLDAVGHLNEGSYFVAFSIASWAFSDTLHIGVEYLKRTGCSLYTVESHLRFLKEVRDAAELRIEASVLEYDAKRVRWALVMSADGIERATLESLGVHIDGATGRSAPIPDNVLARLARFKAPRLPDWAGRGIQLARR